MTSLSLSSDAPSAVRRPVLSINMGGGMGGVAGVMGPDPWLRSTRSVMTRCALAPHADLALIWLADDDQAPEVVVADEGEIGLGYEDDATPTVFSAVVNRISTTLHGTRCVEAVNGSSALGRMRINQSYEKQSAGDIVTDLAGQAGVDIDTVESGPDLPFYVIDDRLSVWEHVALLAQHCGFAAYITPGNQLCFGPLSEGRAAQTLTYGVDILALEVLQAQDPPDTVVVVGEGAAGSQGEEAWSWLIKDPGAVTADAGSGAARKVRAMPALRSAQAVQAAADGLLAAAQRKTVTGRIITAGAPAVSVGATIELADLPVSDLNGNGIVLRVVHEFSKRGGFVSRIDFCKPGSGGGGLP